MRQLIWYHYSRELGIHRASGIFFITEIKRSDDTFSTQIYPYSHFSVQIIAIYLPSSAHVNPTRYIDGIFCAIFGQYACIGGSKSGAQQSCRVTFVA